MGDKRNQKQWMIPIQYTITGLAQVQAESLEKAIELVEAGMFYDIHGEEHSGDYQYTGEWGEEPVDE